MNNKKAAIFIFLGLILLTVGFVVGAKFSIIRERFGWAQKFIEKKNITIAKPIEGEKVGAVFVISGKARVFENSFNYRITDDLGNVLTEGIADSDAKDAGLFGDYQIEVKLNKPLPGSGFVEVFDYSPKDGTVENLTKTAITFENNEKIKVKVFFNNNSFDPAMLDCSNVFAVQREVPQTLAIARAALEALLQGPTNEEKTLGFFSNINDSVLINSLQIENKIARVDFNERLQEGVGGSCRVSAIRSQIEKTLKQFSSVSEVVISINGEKDLILQP